MLRTLVLRSPAGRSTAACASAFCVPFPCVSSRSVSDLSAVSRRAALFTPNFGSNSVVLRASRRTFSSEDAPPPKRPRRWLKFGLMLAGGAIVALPFGFYAFIRPPEGELKVDMSRRNLFTDFLNSELIFHAMSTRDIVFTLLIFKLCSFGFLPKYGPAVLEAAERMGLSTPLYYIIKKTFFKHFCAGETFDEVSKEVEILASQGISVILDHATENEETEAAWENNRRLAESLVDWSARLGTRFVPLKVTQLGSTELLRRATSLLRFCEEHEGATVDGETWTLRLPPSVTDAPPPNLTPDELRHLARLKHRLASVCRAAESSSVSLLVDAEQSFVQPAIDVLSIELASQFNTKRPVVYNTYQLYLTQGLPHLLAHLALAKSAGFYLGAKVVRGAYLKTERQLPGGSAHSPSPRVFPMKLQTDQAYDTGVRLLIDRIARDEKVAVVIATHNLESVLRAGQFIRESRLPSDHPHICFAQLKGMANHLTFGLSHLKFNTSKLLPFAPVHQVVPYLVRRLQENRDIMGGTQVERQLLWTELKRRNFGFGA